MKYARLTTIRSSRKAGTKSAYQEERRTVESIDRRQYENCVDAAPFFRRLGGSETLTREYTKKGYLVTRILSYSPDRELKTERLFDFDV